MTDSAFDADTFLNTSIEAEMDTRAPTIPAAEYKALIDNIKARKAKDSRMLDIFYELIECDQLKADLGREKVVVRQTVFLDFNDQGALELGKGTGKNAQLGRVREAVGQNTGAPWAPSMLKGAGPVMIAVSLRPDDNDPDIQYNDVKRVVAAI